MISNCKGISICFWHNNNEQKTLDELKNSSKKIVKSVTSKSGLSMIMFPLFAKDKNHIVYL